MAGSPGADHVPADVDPLPPTFTEPFTMDWTNRSTFQQVIEFTGQRPGIVSLRESR